jgi:murein DD-endopeptidase MepM/ murein hydrolase activator NlpD
MSAMLVEIEELSQQIADKENEVNELLLKAEEIEKYVNSTQAKLDVAQKEFDKQKEILDGRLVAMYKMGKVEYIDFLLNSESLSAFLSNYYLVSKIIKADSDLLSEVQEKRDSILALEETLKNYQDELEFNIDEATKTKISLTNSKVIKDNKVATLTKDDLEYHKQIEEYRNQIAALEARIKLLAAANASGTPYVGGDFVWPVPGFNGITSKFGMRTHPITGVYKLHTGVDIGAPTGANFVASNKGIVIAAEYNTAYGNFVMIDHGGGIQTLYAHGSQIVTSVGQEVNAGDVVLKVGSTGYATGPHAHFEVRINGTPVEPLTYLQATGYVYN